jgi:hypothetical protein
VTQVTSELTEEIEELELVYRATELVLEYGAIELMLAGWVGPAVGWLS